MQSNICLLVALEKTFKAAALCRLCWTQPPLGRAACRRALAINFANHIQHSAFKHPHTHPHATQCHIESKCAPCVHFVPADNLSLSPSLSLAALSPMSVTNVAIFTPHTRSQEVRIMICTLCKLRYRKYFAPHNKSNNGNNKRRRRVHMINVISDIGLHSAKEKLARFIR